MSYNGLGGYQVVEHSPFRSVMVQQLVSHFDKPVSSSLSFKQLSAPLLVLDKIGAEGEDAYPFWKGILMVSTLFQNILKDLILQ